MMQEREVAAEQAGFSEWLATIEQDTPLSELVEHPDALELPSFEPEELERLEELGRAYAQEIFERDAVPDMPPMDMDERLLEPEPMRDFDLGFDLDR